MLTHGVLPGLYPAKSGSSQAAVLPRGAVWEAEVPVSLHLGQKWQQRTGTTVGPVKNLLVMHVDRHDDNGEADKKR